MNPWHLKCAARVLRGGGLIAYPTEAVYGLGCDPRSERAVHRVLALKGRDPARGLIIIGSHIEQLAPYVRLPEGEALEKVIASWPGPTTWLLTPGPGAPPWITGAHAKVAVRVPAHALARALCERFAAPIVSTSANLSGRRPARTSMGLGRALRRGIDYVLPGEVGGCAAPSEIRDAATDRVVRAGG